MSEQVSTSILGSLSALTAIFVVACAGIVSEQRAGDASLSDTEFVKAIKRHIDYQITWKDAMDNRKKMPGKVVKWSGNIIQAIDDTIQISSRMILKWRWQSDGTPDPDPIPEWLSIDKNDWTNFSFFDNFIFILDHPLPRETRIGDMTQAVAVWDAVLVIGEIIDFQAAVIPSGLNLTVPVLQGYVLSKTNDRNFSNPVWVGNKEAALDQGR